MNFNLKTYKRLKIKHYFKSINFFFFFHGTALNNKNWIKIEQIFFKHKLKYFKVFNTLLTNVLKDSIFKNLSILVHGPILLINCKDHNLALKKIKNSTPLISLLCLKLNNKTYSYEQIKSMKDFTYVKNVHLIYKTMNLLVKKPYYVLKNTKEV